jgi:ABC-type multidrug transport system fused ATPase/permease subunit
MDNKGSIFIDDVNIKDIGVHDLREAISTTPQEPTLFEGFLLFFII